MRRSGARPDHGHQMHEHGSIDVMRLDQTLGQSRHVACASGCMSMRTCLEKGIKLHRFAGILPEQFFTEAGRHREAVVAADQRMVIRCFGDDLAGFVHDVLMCRLQSNARGACRESSLHEPGTCRECSSFASFFSKISDVFHVLFDPLANHVEGLFLRLGGYLR